MYVNGYRQEAKTVTCYGKARCKHRISHVPNLIQVLNAQEVRRLTKIKFDDATSVASSTEPVKISTEVQPLSFVPNRIFKSCFIYQPTILKFFPTLQKLDHDRTSKMADLLI